VNVKDERFSALFSSHHFNIDPTDSHYHKTEGMEALRAEKLQWRQCQMNEFTNGVSIVHDHIYIYRIMVECSVMSEEWACKVCEWKLEVLQKL